MLQAVEEVELKDGAGSSPVEFVFMPIAGLYEQEFSGFGAQAQPVDHGLIRPFLGNEELEEGAVRMGLEISRAANLDAAIKIKPRRQRADALRRAGMEQGLAATQAGRRSMGGLEYLALDHLVIMPV
jgi:hypothetical protein